MQKILRHKDLLFYSLILVAIGVLLIALKPLVIQTYVYVLTAGLLVGHGVFYLLASKEVFFKRLIQAVIFIGTGIALATYPTVLVTILLGLLLLVFPAIRILSAEDKLVQVKLEVPYFVLATATFLLGDALFNVSVKFIGALVILYAIYVFVSIFIYADKYYVKRFK